MMVQNFFGLSNKNTTVRKEVMAGLTTFMTMAYVLVVQPSAMVGFGPEQSFTDINGLVVSKASILIMTALISGLVTLIMALYANVPFALSTGMGTNFLFSALLRSESLSFGNVMAITLISGSIFVILSLFGVRDMIVRLIPANIKTSISVVIGFYIVYLGFSNSGLGDFSEGIALGDLSNPAVFLTILGILIIAVLSAYKVTGALLIGIITITILSIPFGITALPGSITEIPDVTGLRSVMFSYDFTGLISGNTLVLVFIAFFGDFFSTLGTVLGVAQKADLLDENGNYPEIQKPFIVDAFGTLIGSAFGCTTITTFVESSSGVEAGGKTGLTSLTTSMLFFASMLFAPIFLMIPDAATSPALIFVGFSMIAAVSKIDFSNFVESFGPFIMIIFTVFTAGMATGISAGILADVAIKTFTKTEHKVHPGMYILCIPLIMYFIYQ